MRGVTVRDALDGAQTAIGASGSDTARLDAELLLAHALGVNRAALYSDPQREVTGPAVRTYQDLVRRRSVTHEPVAYLLGSKGFRSIDLEVDGRVLVPRPETELLVEVALGLEPGSRVLDVGTGSGAVALALKHERPDLEVTASDISSAALELAQANARRLQLDVSFFEADLLTGLDGDWDAILSNPPYVAERDSASLPADVVAHEPARALFGGEDGLDVVRPLVEAAAQSGAKLLALEIGAGQSDEVAKLIDEAGFERTSRHSDLAGIERVVVGER
ncbi:MAG: peptide chain release factor N(5)-glutamine methyltransferase [Actinobacteria bacterium]|uniref:peptide chain release factor N(5)-glutamine methyltransferase n=1 Tax=freshwater metagenome TaxID=449393 RepID=A0A6J5ZR90_9ZZZZ|nr:peptide chain release factor N(5)-glutamine methyltransferase [Actinomycetota bacterium]